MLAKIIFLIIFFYNFKDNDFVLDTTKKIILNLTSNWQTRSYADIENALYLLYLIGEALPVCFCLI